MATIAGCVLVFLGILVVAKRCYQGAVLGGYLWRFARTRRLEGDGAGQMRARVWALVAAGGALVVLGSAALLWGGPRLETGGTMYEHAADGPPASPSPEVLEAMLYLSFAALAVGTVLLGMGFLRMWTYLERHR